MSERIGTVPAGSYKVGDVLRGYTITGFGRAWTPADDEHNAGYSTETWADRVCYAYGEKAQPAPALAPAMPAPASRPAYGSTEWKQDRLARLPEIIEELEDKAVTYRQSGNANHNSRVSGFVADALKLRAEMDALRAELDEATTRA